ncbi:hypothetical protein GW758_00060 [Candidatus Falkowbacteria bacterium]|nr:hypothetical protein [Candidatus Falkowbacteria bacterium]
MDAKIIRGDFLGSPISGNYVNIDNADVGVLLGAAAGLAKTLFIAGAAAGIIYALVNAYANMERVEETEEEKIKRKGKEKEKEKKREFVSWWTLAQVESWQPASVFTNTTNRKFRGTCLNKTISIVCDSHNLIIPINQIRGYQRFNTKPHYPLFSLHKRYLDHETELKLFDGSVYRGKIESPDKLDFLTPVGQQSILVNDFLTEHSIRSSIIKDVEQLKVNIIKFINENHKKLEDYIDKENFEQFFRI